MLMIIKLLYPNRDSEKCKYARDMWPHLYQLAQISRAIAPDLSRPVVTLPNVTWKQLNLTY